MLALRMPRAIAFAIQFPDFTSQQWTLLYVSIPHQTSYKPHVCFGWAPPCHEFPLKGAMGKLRLGAGRRMELAVAGPLVSGPRSLVPGLWCLVFGVWSLVSGSGDQMPHNIVCKSQPRQTLSWTRARLSQTGSGCCLIFTWAHRPSPAGPGPATRPAQSAQAASQPRSQPGPARPGQPARQVGQPAQPGSPHCPRMQKTRRATQPATQYLQRVAKDFVETLCKY